MSESDKDKEIMRLKQLIMEAGTMLAALYEDWAEEIELDEPAKDILEIIEMCKIEVGYYNDNKKV